MKNLIRTLHGLNECPFEKMQCNVNTPATFKKLFRRYRNENTLGMNQRPDHSAKRHSRFFHKLRSNAMDLMHSETSAGMHFWKEEYLHNTRRDSNNGYNRINHMFYPKLAKHMRKPQISSNCDLSKKMEEMACWLAGQGYPGNAQSIHKELMRISLPIKKWCLEGRIQIVLKNFCGKQVLDFYNPNPDGTIGGFVGSKCHFTGVNRINVSPGSVIRVETTLYKKVIICGTSVVVDCRLASVFISDSYVKDTNARRTSISEYSHVEGSYIRGKHVKGNSTVKDTVSLACSFDRATVIDCDICDRAVEKQTLEDAHDDGVRPGLLPGFQKWART